MLYYLNTTPSKTLYHHALYHTSLHSRLTKEKFYPDFYGPPKPFIAEDPEKVVEKLRRQQELFTQQNQKVLEDRKKEQREAAAKLLGASTSKTFDNVTYHGTEGISVEEEVLLRFSFKEAVYKAIHPFLLTPY